jgi:hypothetical protein
MFNEYMHTYKSIYTYAHMLCTNRFVVIFVVIVWKTTLNTRKKLKRDYLRGLFEKIIWEGPFEGNNLRRERKSGEEIFDKRERDRILRGLRYQTWTNRQVLLIEILNNRVVCLNIPSRPSLSNISPPPSPPPLKLSPSNDPPQMMLLKWFSRIISANNFF